MTSSMITSPLDTVKGSQDRGIHRVRGEIWRIPSEVHTTVSSPGEISRYIRRVLYSVYIVCTVMTIV